MEVKEIPISDIIIPEKRARATFTNEQFEELKASIKTHGFTIPILVRKLDNGKYELIDGEHRIMAAKELGYTKIPAVITSGDEKKVTLLNVLANTARGTQNPMDVAEALARAKEAGATIEELAAATGHTESWVKLYLTLNELPDVYKEALREGRLKVGHIQEAMRLMDPVEIDAALQTALQLGWTVKQLKYYVDTRIEDLRRIRAEKGPDYVPEPPTVEEAQEIVQYGDCMFCHRKIPRKDLMMPVMCPECRTLLEWIIDQLGEPKEAMQTIYNALNLYFDFLRQQERNKLQVVAQGQQQVQQEASNPTENVKQKNEEIELTEEDKKLLKLLKLAKKEGIL